MRTRQLTALTPTRRRLSNRRRGKPRIHRLWLPWFSLDGTKGQPLGRSTLPPPATSTLEDVLSICYQATLLREEGRPVTFRLSLSEPDAFAATGGPPAGLRTDRVELSCTPLPYPRVDDVVTSTEAAR